jgi:hypothetical protein
MIGSTGGSKLRTEIKYRCVKAGGWSTGLNDDLVFCHGCEREGKLTLAVNPCAWHGVGDRWLHPRLRIERAVRTVPADRLTRGMAKRTDRTLAARVAERQRITRAWWST